MGIIVQVFGSVFNQLGKLKTTSLNYLLLNAIGALIFRNRCIYWKTMGICFT